MADHSVSIARHYHQRTKYDPATLAQTAKPLDWDTQPPVFKEYKLGTAYTLTPFLTDQPLDPSDIRAEAIANDPSLVYEWKRLARLFLCSYGLTAKMRTMLPTPLYFRAVPSAGGLYPAEVYLLSRGTACLPPGLYHYQPQSNSLLHFWDSPVWSELQQASLWHPALEHTHMALVTTAIFFRSAWRYQARAYRRICLDTGHLIGNIELACAINHYRAHLIGGFVDDALNQLLYLDAEQEGAIALLPLADGLKIEQNLPPYPTAAPSPKYDAYGAIDDDELLHYFHQATQIQSDQDINWRTIRRYERPHALMDMAEMTDGAAGVGDQTELGAFPDETVQDGAVADSGDGLSPDRISADSLADDMPADDTPADDTPADDTPAGAGTPARAGDKYNFPFCYKVSMASDSISWGTDLLDLEKTILKRRSTRAFSGLSFSLNDLKLMLHFTYQPQDYAEQGLEKDPDYLNLGRLETFVVVSGVDGLDEGCYYYSPIAQELRQIRFKNFRKEVQQLSLGQELGRDAGAVIFHTADLAQAVDQYGDRAYRYLHMDAGHLGQRLNLAAIRLGLGVSGIGGFFDDAVNEVLGIPVDEAVVYITTLGRPR